MPLARGPYELDLVVENLRGGPDAWDAPLILKAGELARDLVTRCGSRPYDRALAAGSPLDDLDEALRAAEAGGVGGFFAKRKLRKIRRNRRLWLADDYRQDLCRCRTGATARLTDRGTIGPSGTADSARVRPGDRASARSRAGRRTTPWRWCGCTAVSPPPRWPPWLTVAVVDDAGRLLDIRDISDDPAGYAQLGALLADRSGGVRPVALDRARPPGHPAARRGEPAAGDRRRRRARRLRRPLRRRRLARRDAGPARQRRADRPRPRAAGRRALRHRAEPVPEPGRAQAGAGRARRDDRRPAGRRGRPARGAARALPGRAARLPRPGRVDPARDPRRAARAGLLSASAVEPQPRKSAHRRRTDRQRRRRRDHRDRTPSPRCGWRSTSRRGWTPTELAPAVAETVRQAVAAVRACDAAIAALVAPSLASGLGAMAGGASAGRPAASTRRGRRARSPAGARPTRIRGPSGRGRRRAGSPPRASAASRPQRPGSGRGIDGRPRRLPLVEPTPRGPDAAGIRRPDTVRAAHRASRRSRTGRRPHYVTTGSVAYGPHVSKPLLQRRLAVPYDLTGTRVAGTTVTPVRRGYPRYEHTARTGPRRLSVAPVRPADGRTGPQRTAAAAIGSADVRAGAAGSASWSTPYGRRPAPSAYGPDDPLLSFHRGCDPAAHATCAWCRRRGPARPDVDPADEPGTPSTRRSGPTGASGVRRRPADLLAGPLGVVHTEPPTSPPHATDDWVEPRRRWLACGRAAHPAQRSAPTRRPACPAACPGQPGARLGSSRAAAGCASSVTPRSIAAHTDGLLPWLAAGSRDRRLRGRPA